MTYLELMNEKKINGIAITDADNEIIASHLKTLERGSDELINTLIEIIDGIDKRDPLEDTIDFINRREKEMKAGTYGIVILTELHLTLRKYSTELLQVLIITDQEAITNQII